jgi:hypothetical protein
MGKDFKELLAIAIQEAPNISRKYYQVILRGNEDDIHKIELILGRLHEEYKKNGKSDEMTIHQRIFSFYLGEIIARKIGYGEWQENNPLPNAISLRLGDTNWIFPFSWCLKRVEDGIGDDICFKYKATIQSINEKKHT